MTARSVMFQGTGSDVGKSLIVAGICRALTNRGYRVRPFKAQNMSNNAAVTTDGGEIGRAQALQAQACHVAPTVHMNPVLLKPQSETGAQVVVQGRVADTQDAREYQENKKQLMPAVLESFAKVKEGADFVLVEGAGSASEVNLRSNDIANMGFAVAADVPVVLIGDIERGGVIASLIGTQITVAPDDGKLISGFVVNKMRGDPTLFDDGMAFIAQRTGWRAIGLVPYFDAAARLPAEDAMALSQWKPTGGGRLRIAIPMAPGISNFDDLDPLRLEPDVDVLPVRAGDVLQDCDLVILPGSKTPISDLAYFRNQGWDIDIQAHHRKGGHVLGVCGGYQMLGRTLADPGGVEGTLGQVPGLGLLSVETVLGGDKTLREVSGVTCADGTTFTGYEMHIGETTGPDTAHPFARLSESRNDGAVSENGHVSGTYVHGLFAGDGLRAAWLRRFDAAPSDLNYENDVGATLDALAAHLEDHVNIDELLNLAR